RSKRDWSSDVCSSDLNHRSHTNCTMWVKWKNNAFDVQRMEVKRNDRFGHLLKKWELKNLTTEKVPTVKEALTVVIEKPKEQITRSEERRVGKESRTQW